MFRVFVNHLNLRKWCLFWGLRWQSTHFVYRIELNYPWVFAVMKKRVSEYSMLAWCDFNAEAEFYITGENWSPHGYLCYQIHSVLYILHPKHPVLHRHCWLQIQAVFIRHYCLHSGFECIKSSFLSAIANVFFSLHGSSYTLLPLNLVFFKNKCTCCSRC